MNATHCNCRRRGDDRPVRGGDVRGVHGEHEAPELDVPPALERGGDLRREVPVAVHAHYGLAPGLGPAQRARGHALHRARPNHEHELRRLYAYVLALPLALVHAQCSLIRKFISVLIRVCTNTV